MKKTVMALLVFCSCLFPVFLNAEDSEEIDLSKYNTLNFKEALEEEEIDMKYTDYKETDDQAVIYLFRGKGCTYCRSFLNFANDIAEEYGKYFKIVSFESWYDSDNAELLDTISNYLDQPAGGVPYIIIGDQVFAGYASDYDDQIKTAIKDLYDSEDRYDVFEEYNKSLKEAEKAEKAVYNRIIIWNFVFVVISTAVIMLYVNKSNKKLLETINNSKETVKVEKLDKKNDYHKSNKKVVKKNHEEV
jgi:thiol-disulfide isomerase/thioredoxin